MSGCRNTEWTNSEKNIPFYFLLQDVLLYVLLKPIVPMSMIQAKKMQFGAKKSKISMIFLKKMHKITVFYVAVNFGHRKHVDPLNHLKLSRHVESVLRIVYAVYFIIHSPKLLPLLSFKPVSPSFLHQ